MITVNDIRVSSDSTNITVDVTPPIGDALVSARLWDATTYKVVADAIDFSDLTGAGPFFADIEVTIPATRLGLTAYNGVYFLEIVTETLLNVESTMEVAISATTAYHKCILDKILNISVDNCKLVTTEDCKECSPHINEIDTFIDGLYLALEQQEFLTIQKIDKLITGLCPGCCTTPTDTVNTDNFSGTRIISGANVQY